MTVIRSTPGDRTQVATIRFSRPGYGDRDRAGLRGHRRGPGYRGLAALGLVAVCIAIALAGCGSAPDQQAAPAAPAVGATETASVVSAPVRVADTRLGTVGYRVLGSGPALVLIMGYAGTMQTWDPRFVDALAQQYRVVIFDNAGVGRTAALPAPLTIDAMADQASALISALGLGRPNVLGWSMGGMIAQALAVRHPAQVRRLVLCATFPGTGTQAPSQAAIKALTSSNPQQVSADLFPADQAMAWDAFTAGLSAYPAASPAPAATIAAQGHAAAEWFGGTDPAGRETADISAPTLIADGTVDRVDPIANDHALARLIPGSRLVLYPDAGHAFLFQEGTSFTSRIESFLTGTPRPLSMSGMRTQFLADDAKLNVASKTWITSLRALPSGATLAQIGVIDQVFATAFDKFDSQLAGFDATGTAGAAITSVVNANANALDDLLAFPVQTSSSAATWKAADAKASKAQEKAVAGLRKALGLPPQP